MSLHRFYIVVLRSDKTNQGSAVLVTQPHATCPPKCKSLGPPSTHSKKPRSVLRMDEILDDAPTIQSVDRMVGAMMRDPYHMGAQVGDSCSHQLAK
jgi:hypothetical protein